MHDALFSTVSLANGQVAELQAFSVAVGAIKPGAAVALTNRETNIKGSGSTGLPAGWEALVYSIQVGIGMGFAATIADMRNIYLNTLFDFQLGIKSYAKRAVYYFPTGGGLWGVTTMNGAENWNNGFPDARAKSAFLIPHHLKESVSYVGVLSFEAALVLAAGPYDVEVSLEGLIKRPVQ